MTDQVQQVRRRLVDSLQPREIDMLVQITSLPRNAVLDVMILFKDTLLPPVNVHSIWLEWSKVMAYTGTSEKVSFVDYARMKRKQMEEAHAAHP